MIFIIFPKKSSPYSPDSLFYGDLRIFPVDGGYWRAQLKLIAEPIGEPAKVMKRADSPRINSTSNPNRSGFPPSGRDFVQRRMWKGRPFGLTPRFAQNGFAGQAGFFSCICRSNCGILYVISNLRLFK